MTTLESISNMRAGYTMDLTGANTAEYDQKHRFGNNPTHPYEFMTHCLSELAAMK